MHGTKADLCNILAQNDPSHHWHGTAQKRAQIRYFFMDLSLQIVSFNSQENRLSGSM
jgi:hypothetical protein